MTRRGETTNKRTPKMDSKAVTFLGRKANLSPWDQGKLLYGSDYLSFDLQWFLKVKALAINPLCWEASLKLILKVKSFA